MSRGGGITIGVRSKQEWRQRFSGSFEKFAFYTERIEILQADAKDSFGIVVVRRTGGFGESTWENLVRVLFVTKSNDEWRIAGATACAPPPH